MDAAAQDDLLRRIWAEYSEMPGLSLTVFQGQRLWGLDRFTCTTALELLTAAGFLRRTVSGHYLRATEGRTSPLRMARADGAHDVPSILKEPRRNAS